MKCQRCQKNEANTHFRQNINGNVEEFFLCSDCAGELGLNMGNIFASFNPFAGMFSAFAGMPSGFGRALPSQTRCKTCGLSFREIAERGSVGCADCYETFRSELAPSIERIHGRAVHNGKHPGKAVPVENGQPVQVSELAELKQKLQKAIDAQEYEQAAVYRDRIKELENSDH